MISVRDIVVLFMVLIAFVAMLMMAREGEWYNIISGQPHLAVIMLFGFLLTVILI